MAAQGGDRPDGAVAGFAGVARRSTQVMRLVDDQQVDPDLDRLPGEVRILLQHLQRDHHPAVRLERIEAAAVVLLDVQEPLVVQQHEDLVVLAPQLAQPLHGQGGRCDDQRPLGAPGTQ